MKVLLIHTDIENENKDYGDTLKYMDNEKIDFTYISIQNFDENFEYYFIHFDFVFIDINNKNDLDIDLIRKYNKYSSILYVPIVLFFKSEDMPVFIEEIRNDSFDYLIHPITTDDILVKITQSVMSKNEIQVENKKMILKGNLLTKLEHQWKQPLNLISTNLLNLEIKSELGKLEHNSVQKINNNIESALMKISNNISLVNKCFQSSKNKTNFSITDAIEKNLNLLLYRLTQNNIKLEKVTKNLDIKINNYENEFSLNIMLILYLLIECSIKDKDKYENENDDIIIEISCEKNDKNSSLNISLNRCFPLSFVIEFYNIEMSLIKNLFIKTEVEYLFSEKEKNTFFQISLETEN